MGCLRFTLAMSVVVYHSGAFFGWLPYNGTAVVNYFFVISGYYMALILNEKYVGSGSQFLFWSNRFTRLWPSFMFVSIFIAILRFDELAAAFQHLQPLSAWLVVVQNSTMIGYEFFDLLSIDGAGGFFLNLKPSDDITAREFVLLGQGWSIGLELWFYMLAPFVVRSFRKTLIWLAIGLVLFATTRYWADSEVWKYRFFPSVMPFFALGALSYHLNRISSSWPIRPIIDKIAVRVMFPLTILLLLYPEPMNLVLPERHHLKLFLLIAIPCLPIWLKASQKYPLDRLLGDLSYPLYLNHTLVIMVVRPFLDNQGMGTSWRSIAVLLVSTALAYVMLRLIERPIDKWRQRRIKPLIQRRAP